MSGKLERRYGRSVSEQLMKNLIPIRSITQMPDVMALTRSTGLVNQQLLNVTQPMREVTERLNRTINSMEIARVTRSANRISNIMRPTTMTGINSAVQSLQEVARLQGNMKTTFKGLSLGIDPTLIKTIQDLSIDMSGIEKAIQSNLEIFRGIDWSEIIAHEDLDEFEIDIILDTSVIDINENITFWEQIAEFINKFAPKHPNIYILLCIFVFSPIQSAIDDAVLNLIREKTVPIIQEAQTQDYKVIEKNLKIEVNNTLNINIESQDAKDELLKGYGYVSAEKLIMRRTNRVKSRAVHTLEFGQVVKIINKNRNWTLVEYEDDEDIIQGWVFTQYISKFKK